MLMRKAETMAADYYSELLDLEALDPESGRSGRTWDREGQGTVFASECFRASQCGIASLAASAGLLGEELQIKLPPAQTLKERLFLELPLPSGRLSLDELANLSPKRLSEIELNAWKPGCLSEHPEWLAVERPVREDWNARRVDNRDAGQVLDFYRQSESYIFELMAANHLVETLYNYSVTVGKLAKVGVTELLDYGAGIGSFALAARAAGIRVRHMDLESKTLAFARWRYETRSAGVDVIVASGDHDDIPRSQAIVCTEVVEHLTQPIALLDALAAATIEGGCVVVSESCHYLEKFISHLPQNQWLGGNEFLRQMSIRGFKEVFPEPAVHPKVFQKQGPRST